MAAGPNLFEIKTASKIWELKDERKELDEKK
jgi:hypothetical protein